MVKLTLMSSLEHKLKKHIYIPLLLLLLVIAAWLFLYSTEHGVGLTNDSAAYIGGARSILSGNGYSRLGGDRLPRPITQFPPMYSLSIAAISKVSGNEALSAARFLNLLGFLCSLALFVSFIRKASSSNLAAILGALCFLCCAPILQAGIYGLSEALFMPLLLLLLGLAYDAVKAQKADLRWLATGLLCGLLILTRYAGAAFFAAILLYALSSLHGWRSRGRAALLLTCGFLVPLTVWLLRNRSLQVSALNRSGAYHLPGMDKVYEGITNLAGFFLPEFGGLVEKHLNFWGLIIALGLLLLLIWVLFQFLRTLFSKEPSAHPALLPALCALVYLCLLIFTAIFVDGSTVFDDRMLLPFYLMLLLLIFVQCGIGLSRCFRSIAILSLAVMLSLSLLLFEDELDKIRLYHEDGQGFAGSEWVDSEIRQAAAKLDAGKELFSNRQTFLWLMNDQPAFIIPPLYNAANAADRQTFEAERQWMFDEVMSGKACVVVFNYDELMADEGDKAWLDAVLKGLPVQEKCQDGIIFGL